MKDYEPTDFDNTCPSDVDLFSTDTTFSKGHAEITVTLSQADITSPLTALDDKIIHGSGGNVLGETATASRDDSTVLSNQVTSSPAAATAVDSELFWCIVSSGRA